VVGISAIVGAGLASCSGGGTGSSSGLVTIKVDGLPTKQANPAGRKQFLADVAAFNTLHKGKIKVVPSEYVWSADTFAPRLASGQLENVFYVPFTEPQKLISRHQAADITPYLSVVPSVKSANPKLLSIGQSSGKTYGVPTAGYAEGLIYNRTLFTRAGLDPNKPPTTWDDVRADAKKISALSKNIVGFNMPTEDNYGGWYFTMMNYSFGNLMETKKNGKYAANFPNAKSIQVLKLLHDMHWTDHSMGSKGLQTAADVEKQMAAGQLGMYTAAGDNINTVVTQYGGNLKDFGLSSYPQQGGNSTLAGGSMEMFNPKDTPAQIKAALQWVQYEYLRSYTDSSAAKRVFAAQAKDKTTYIGVPAVPLFSGSLQQRYLNAENSYINAPVNNYRSYGSWLKTVKLQPEPPVSAQLVYKALDSAVQQVLTKQGADPRSALQSAAGQATTAISSGS
jgi:ABC-type glycerol-3-phosphate transport system substrate-binding protein